MAINLLRHRPPLVEHSDAPGNGPSLRGLVETARGRPRARCGLCGAGLTTAELLHRGYHVVACDVSEKMLDLARENCSQVGENSSVSFQLQNAEDLKLDNDSFDLVVAMGLIEYLEWDRWAMQEMHRVLKPGGHLIATVPNKLRLSNLAEPTWVAQQAKIRLRRGAPLSPTSGGNDATNGESSTVQGSPSQAEPPAFARRQYVPRNFDGTLQQLGFTIRASMSHGFGPFRALRRSNRVTVALHQLIQACSGLVFVPWLDRFGSNYNVLCQKGENEVEQRRHRLNTNIKANWAPFRRTYSAAFQRLHEWTAQHSEFTNMPVRQLEALVDGSSDVLVLSPHPDDEIIGCGGTLAKLIGRGAKVTVVHMTDGSATAGLRDATEEERSTVRLGEAQEVGRRLGVAELILLKQPDMGLECNGETVEALAQMLDRVRPSAVFAPFINDPHRDHRATNQILKVAMTSADVGPNSATVFGYEVWSFVAPNVLCLIDDQFEDKAELLFRYRTGMKVVDYVRFCEALNSYNAHKELAHKGYAEAFFALDAQTYLEL